MSTTRPTHSSRMKPAKPTAQPSNLCSALMSEDLKTERLLLGTICFHYDHKNDGSRKTLLNVELAMSTGLKRAHFISEELSNIFLAMTTMWRYKQKLTPATLAIEIARWWTDRSSPQDFIAECIREAGDTSNEALIGIISNIIAKSHHRSLIFAARAFLPMAERQVTEPKELATLFANLLNGHVADFRRDSEVFQNAARQVKQMPPV